MTLQEAIEAATKKASEYNWSYVVVKTHPQQQWYDTQKLSVFLLYGCLSPWVCTVDPGEGPRFNLELAVPQPKPTEKLPESMHEDFRSLTPNADAADRKLVDKMEAMVKGSGEAEVGG